ncbi:MAG TPA: cytochrome c maturation protein CcmE [Acidimicrobiales bacterium]|jgi:cytochrome c-type biogenesis protein CcmE|nr:cytochrome c maturation protein CcmE [Acidimicrobiales bacterium]
MDVTRPEVDLAPRATTDLAAPSPPRRRRWMWAGGLAAVLGVAAFIVFQFLANATLYFCNADEVGERSACSEGDRFRLQGTVDDGSVELTETGMTFTVTHNGATWPVRYEGEPGGIFDEGIPVVVEGRLVGGTFEGDRVLVKHSSTYREKNPDRVPAGAP